MNIKKRLARLEQNRATTSNREFSTVELAQHIWWILYQLEAGIYILPKGSKFADVGAYQAHLLNLLGSVGELGSIRCAGIDQG